jgi:hypothetical protein
MILDKMVEELKQVIAFKETTTAGDVVLIMAKEPQMLVYAYVCSIERDKGRKDEWWHVHMEMLSIPLQKITWTLRTEQITGQEIFTMGGEQRFIKAVDFSTGEQPKTLTTKSAGKISALKRVK